MPAAGPSALPTGPDPPHPRPSIRRSRSRGRPGNRLMDTRCLARPVREQAGSGTGHLPCGRTGQDGSRCCCSGCRRCSCSGSRHGGSPVCCSRNRHGSRAGRLLAHSPCEHGLGEDHPAKALRVGMFRMADPALSRGHDLGPLQTPRSIGLRHPTKFSGKAVTIIVAQPTPIRIDEIAEEDSARRQQA